MRGGVCVIWGSRKAAFLLYDILLNLPIVLLQIDYVKTCKTAKNPYRY